MRCIVFFQSSDELPNNGLIELRGSAATIQATAPAADAEDDTADAAVTAFVHWGISRNLDVTLMDAETMQAAADFYFVDEPDAEDFEIEDVPDNRGPDGKVSQAEACAMIGCSPIELLDGALIGRPTLLIGMADLPELAAGVERRRQISGAGEI